MDHANPNHDTQSAIGFWTPNSQLGFIPLVPSVSAEELAASSDPTLCSLGSNTPLLGNMSNEELTDYVSSLPDTISHQIHDISIPHSESILRCYVNLSTHLIHRPHFSTSKSLPPNVAIPLWYLSKKIQRPPSLTYATYVLSNFTTPISPSSPPQLLNISDTPSGTPDEAWFVAVHLSVESAGGVSVYATESIEQALRRDDHDAIIAALDLLNASLSFAIETLPSVKERLDPATFRDKIRPFLFGHSPVQFIGVPGNPTITYVGETGAQSGFIKAADSLLGTPHSSDTLAPMQHFLECAPIPHRAFFERAAAVGNSLSLIRANQQLQKRRKSCLQLLAQFRRIHLALVTDYLLPNGKVLSEHGTGGTVFQTWLNSLIAETDAAADAS